MMELCWAASISTTTRHAPQKRARGMLTFLLLLTILAIITGTGIEPGQKRMPTTTEKLVGKGGATSITAAPKSTTAAAVKRGAG